MLRCGPSSRAAGPSKAGRQFARLPFGAAADLFIEQRKLHISERTAQLDRERLKPLRLYFGETPLLRVTASEVSAYQRARLSGRIRLKPNSTTLNTVGNRTVNMEVTVLRQLMRRAKVWLVISEDVKMLPERHAVVGRVLTREQKALLFQVAGSRDAWIVAHCAAVLAVSTTCRKIELRHLRWRNVDVFDRSINVQRTKRESGRRVIPLNGDALAALVRLLERARVNAANEPDHFVFPTCEHERIDATRPQKSWRSAWRSLTKAAGKAAARKQRSLQLSKVKTRKKRTSGRRLHSRGSASTICGTRRLPNSPSRVPQMRQSWPLRVTFRDR